MITAELPSGSTYEIESSTNGTAWNPTGVLVGGTASSNTLRLDGFPSGHSYRLSRIGAAGTIAPTIAKGLHLNASFPGAGEVRFQSATQLMTADWSHHAFAFADSSNAFRVPLRSATEPHTFFRAVQPAAPLVLATVTSFQVEPQATGAGYGVVLDDMPEFYQDGFIGAFCPDLYHRNGTNAAAAGECYELAGPAGKCVVMIADIAPSSPPGTCDPGRYYFDIGTPAFTNLFRGGIGYGTATFRLVPAPVTGNVKLVSVIASGGYYFELRPYNHRAGVTKLEVQGSGGSWIELPRTAYNSFVYNTGIEMIFPMNVRVTSRFGEVVTFPPIPSMAEGSRFTANGQFAVFPDQGPSPVWVLPPVYTDSFSNIVGAQWTTSTYNSPSVTTASPADAFEGTAALRISGLNAFSGVMFHSPLRFPRQLDGWLEFAIRSEGAAINGLSVVISGIDAGGSAAQSTTLSLPTIGSTWRRLHILLDPAQSPDEILQVQLMNPTGAALPSVLLDSIAFRW